MIALFYVAILLNYTLLIEFIFLSMKDLNLFFFLDFYMNIYGFFIYINELHFYILLFLFYNTISFLVFKGI